jgi:TrmH family RNA methyltransferase
MKSFGHIRISSTSNPRIRGFLHARERKEHGSFFIEGKNLVEAALESGASLREVCFEEGFTSRSGGQRLLERLYSKRIPLFEVTDRLMKKLSDTGTPQGVAAVVSYTEPTLEELTLGRLPLIAVLDRLQDPGNVGVLIRTADACGADAVILLPGTCDAFMPKVLRSTAGSIFHLPVIRAETEEFLSWASKKKITLVGTAAEASSTVFDAALDKPAAMVFGNESQGLSPGIREAANFLVRIPIFGKAESLNVSAAAAVCLYEAARQRTTKS